ncbi:ABC transporter permease [Arthrobacter sp. CAU 1506]|uniref:ABC transporter permease n=1 Tax=Arthrobacter sp. CAU 1506 TaxID=2560052 RepID=UPI0010AB915F|nr:ABC transporter permease [Arthrobacter sp. CAU 1506]TJY69431.1 ABC transporter permease [Arthrobacter sp. CAU 1506]
MTAQPSVDAALAPARSRDGLWSRTRTLVLQQPILQMLVLAVIVAWLVATVPGIANLRSATALLIIASLLALAAMGQTLVVILGGLDLAIPGYVIFGAFVAANLAGGQGWPVPVAFLVTIAVCGGLGAAIGYLCHRLRVEPLMMTLGMGAVITGGTLFLTHGNYAAAPPDSLRALAGVTSKTFSLPIPPIILIVAAAAVLLWLGLTRTPAGRSLYATGINVRAAKLTRINTTAVWTIVFAASGALAGIAGMFIASFSSGWAQSIGEPYLFSGLAAVLVGGTTFGSIRGSFTRTLLGALILTGLSTIIVSNGLAEAQSRIIYGAIILMVVALYGRERHVRDRF